MEQRKNQKLMVIFTNNFRPQLHPCAASSPTKDPSKLLIAGAVQFFCFFGNLLALHRFSFVSFNRFLLPSHYLDFRLVMSKNRASNFIWLRSVISIRFVVLLNRVSSFVQEEGN
ncbi:unnamed protein product [Lactuca saligna]|uniref:Transmembrane protein n=1 Tax=Lactuca saligna TaxID=75948 RepID=A0AA35VDW4_LACSI|nr:unnamed protein product [Lactuca saligna]